MTERIVAGFEFLSTLSLRRATTAIATSTGAFTIISIHALLAESDLANRVRDAQNLDFYPRSPCGERHMQLQLCRTKSKFLSTLSLRRATRHPERRTAGNRHFYPRSPCGERLPMTERIVAGFEFLSTLSLRRATPAAMGYYPAVSISIHALLAESDVVAVHNTDGALNFYPRSPCGERHNRLSMFHTSLTFLSTLSLRRATNWRPRESTQLCISIHALLAESDTCQPR